MFEKFLLQVLPQAEEILNFKPEVGRGKVFWVYFKNQLGKASTFLKKKISSWIQKIYATFEQYNWLDMNTVESPSGRVYEVSEYSCSCPDYRHNISKGKTWRTFCKHQLMQFVNKFSESINTSQKYQVDCVNVPDGISIEYQPYWEDEQTFDVYYKRERIGEIEVTPEGFETSTTKGFKHTFTTQESSINYLLKQKKLSPDQLLEEQEQQAMRDLFGDDMYPEEPPEYPMQEYFEEEKREESKPTKKWFSLANLQNQEMPF